MHDEAAAVLRGRTRAMEDVARAFGQGFGEVSSPAEMQSALREFLGRHSGMDHARAFDRLLPLAEEAFAGPAEAAADMRRDIIKAMRARAPKWRIEEIARDYDFALSAEAVDFHLRSCVSLTDYDASAPKPRGRRRR